MLPTVTPEQGILTTREGDIHSQGFRAGFSAALYDVTAAMPRLVAEAARQSGERSADALDAAMRPLLLREIEEILCSWDNDASIDATAFDADALA